MKTQTIIILLVILLASCAPVSTPVPIRMPTDTLQPTNTRTPEPIDTPTPVSITLSNFNPSLVGVGEHGAMICIIYQGTVSDIEGITLKADIGQTGKVLDRAVTAETIENKTCFEMLDAKYTLGKTISLTINATARGKILQNDEQRTMLGNYGLVDDKTGEIKPYPFIHPLFSESDVPNGKSLVIGDHYKKDHKQYAFDLFISQNEISPGIEGTTIRMPFTIDMVGYVDDMETKPNVELFVRHPYTGFRCSFQHIQIPENSPLFEIIQKKWWWENTGNGKIELAKPILYDSRLVFVVIGPQDKFSGQPHLHFDCQNTNLQGGQRQWLDVIGYILNDFNKDPTGNPNFPVDNYLLKGWIQP